MPVPMPPNSKNILITGAASGLGKAFVRAYLRDESHSVNAVFAIDKSFSASLSSCPTTGQDAILDANAYRDDVFGGCGGGDDSSYDLLKKKLRLFSIDVRDDESEIVARLRQHVHVDNLDLVIHSAGVRGLEPSVPVRESADVAAAEKVDVLTQRTMMDTFHVNAVGTYVLVRALLPMLQRRGIGGGGGNEGKRAKVIIMGSRMGSVGSNETGGGYAYRASKAAVNAVVKSFSIDVPEVLFVIVHPGRVESALVAVKEDGAISAEESVREMLGLIERLGERDSGRFLDRFGHEVPW